MPLFNPTIPATGGTISGNLTVSGNLVTTGTDAPGGVLSPGAGVNTAGSAPVLTPAFGNGVAAQLADLGRDYIVYFQIGTAGTGFTLAIGPTSTPANTIFASATPVSEELLSFRLPAGWFVKWAGTNTTLANQAAVGC